MAVNFSKVLQTSTITKMPDDTGAVQWSEGFNIGAGTMEYMLLRGDCTWDADPVANGGIDGLVQNLRIIINGEVCFSFTAGYEGTTAGIFGYFLNSIGGSSYEVSDGVATREWYWAIPLGRTYTNTEVVRAEVVVGWYQGAGDIQSGTMEWWVKYNDNTQVTTTVAPSTSFTHSANSIEQVIVKVPQNAPAGSVVSGLLVQTNSANDYLGSQGIRINALSDFGIEVQMIRFLNGDMANGILFNAAAGGANQQIITELAGVNLIQTYGLTGGDLTLQVDNTTGCTRYYTPILTSPVGSRERAEVRQTQSEPVNTAKAILAGVGVQGK